MRSTRRDLLKFGTLAAAAAALPAFAMPAAAAAPVAKAARSLNILILGGTGRARWSNSTATATRPT